MSEAQLVDACHAWIEDHRPDVRVVREVPFLSRCIDMVLLTGTGTVTGEFKIKDWRHAIIQARDHRLGADYAYVCMPYRRTNDDMTGALDKWGIGLLLWRDDGTLIEARPAARNDNRVHALTRQMHGTIERMGRRKTE